MSAPYCDSCQVNMICEKNEVLVSCGHGYVKSGDRFRCPTCNASVVIGFGKIFLPYDNKDHDIAKDERDIQFEELEL